jgi:hypothetical protein
MSKKKTNTKVTFGPTYNGKPILTDKARGYGCREDILKRIEERMDHATESYRKVLCTRMDLRYPKGSKVPSDNKQVSSFLAKYTRNLKRNGNAPQYVCVREQSREKHQHYHLFLITNQKNHRYPQKMVAKAEELWASTIKPENPKGLIDPCTKSRTGQQQPNSYRLNQNEDDFEQTKAKAFERASYLAKENTKGNQPKRQREVLCSRLPKDKK